MLDRAFLKAFFEKLEAYTVDELQTKIDEVEKVRKATSRGSEAHLDARFLLKHLRREQLARLLNADGGNRS